jgi:hypothetical protein
MLMAKSAELAQNKLILMLFLIARGGIITPLAAHTL